MNRFHINTDNSDRDELIRIIRVCESELDTAFFRRRLMLGSLIVNFILVGFIIGALLP